MPATSVLARSWARHMLVERSRTHETKDSPRPSGIECSAALSLRRTYSADTHDRLKTYRSLREDLLLLNLLLMSVCDTLVH